MKGHLGQDFSSLRLTFLEMFHFGTSNDKKPRGQSILSEYQAKIADQLMEMLLSKVFKG